MVEDITIRKGYKQTDLGVIPEDWDAITYGQAFNFLSTATYPRGELSDDGEIKYVHYGDIHTKWNHFLDFKKNSLPTVKKEKAKNYHLLKEGDLIMVDASEDYAGVAKSVEIKNIGLIKAISGLHTFLLRDKNNIFVNGFRGYISSNWLVKINLNKLATGLKVYGVSKSNLKTIQIPRPPKPEQSGIATVLFDTDALIEHLKKLITKKKDIKQGAMQQLLTGKKRLPGFNGKWEVKKIGDIATVGRGRVISHREMDPLIQGKYPVYSSQTSDNGIMGYINTFDFDGEYVTWTTDGERAGTVFYRDGKFNCTNVCGTIKLKKDNSRFIAMILGTSTPKFVSRNLANPKLMNDPVKKIEIPLPNINEQAAIATILSDMDLEIEKLELKLEKYKMLKQGIMQQLLTGKIRLL